MAISVHELTEYISWASDDYLHLALSDGTDGKITKANIINGLAIPGALDVYYVKRSNNLSDIANPELARTNLNLGSVALLNEITKNDIVDFNEADYATAAQGALANSALQPGDNISELVNDAGYILTSQKGVANGVASLDSNGKIPEIQIPAIAISNTFVVDSELEMLALDAQVGDIAIRNDESKSYILQGTDASDLSDWQDLKTPAGGVASVNGQTGTVVLDADDIDDSVTTNKFVTSAQITKLTGIEAGAQVNTVDSVNGQTGTVVLVKADVGLSNVDNTADLAKPVSTATQTALNAKQDTITGAATTITGSNLTADRAVISNGSGKVAVSTVTSTELGYVAGVTSAIQTQLNDKATSAQGALADTAVQPGANITVLTNDAGYITSAGAPVQSVNGLTGTVVLTKASVGLGNVDDTSDLAKPISTATQTALDGKQATITGAATTITGSNLTASRALVSDASGKVAVSSVMSSEVAHLSGVTAGIQGQINAKANSSVNLVAGTGLTGGGNLTADRSFAVTYGTTAGTAAQGNDTRLSDAREWTASTITQSEAEAGTATTRRAWTAQRVRQAITAWWNGSADKNKLDGIAAGAEVNQNTFTTISVAGQGNVVADTKTDTLTLVGGVGVNIFTDPVTDTITFEATGTGTGAIEEVIAGNGLTGGGSSSTVTLNVSYGTTAGTAAQGNDSRLSDSREWNAATVTQVDAEAGTSTTRTAWTAQRVRQAIVAWWNTVGTTVGKAILNLANPGAIRFLRINADNTVTARTAAEIQTDLGLGTAATATLTTSISDTTVGRVLKVGDFNIGVSPLIETNVDLNTKTTYGHYLISSTGITNAPEAGLNGLLVVYPVHAGFTTSAIAQEFTVFTGVNTSRKFTRSRTNETTWTNWVEYFNSNSTIPLTNGGTGATSASAARANLGLGNSSTLNTGTTAGTVAAGDHTHAAATTSAAGFMSSADKTKLNGIASGATANQTDAFLLSRANHTGSQSYTTITGLGTAATGNVVTSASDITGGRVLTVGYGGLGVGIVEDDFSTITAGTGRNKLFRTSYQPSDRPEGTANYLSGIIFGHNATDHETVIAAGSTNTEQGGALHFRNKVTGTWQPWRRVLDSNQLTQSNADTTSSRIPTVDWVQTQLNGKVNTADSIPASRINDLVPNTVAVSNSSGGLTTALVPVTALNHIGTLTSNAQTQLNGKASTAVATTSSAGLMAHTDKTKLNGIEAGAEVNQNAFTTIAVSGQSNVVADSKTDTLTIAAGSGITLTTNATTDTITIAATGSGTVTEVVAGSGLTGGGTSSTVTLDVGAGDGISVAANTVAVNSTVVRTTGAQSIGGAKTFTSEVTAPSFNTSSSLKYKTDIGEFENALEKLMAIDVITYKRKIQEGEPQDDKVYLGVSAESLAKVVPELVRFKDGEPDSVNYAQGFALCVQAIQELVKEMKKQ